jgi:uncharacterized protein with HEPN domain
MTEEILVWLHDIKVQIQEVEEFYSSTGRSFQIFSTNKMLRKAIERNFEIIGEAMVRVLDKDPNISITNARRIISFRNKIAHECDKLDDETLYNISVIYLPTLLREVTVILDQHKP